MMPWQGLHKFSEQIFLVSPVAQSGQQRNGECPLGLPTFSGCFGRVSVSAVMRIAQQWARSGPVAKFRSLGRNKSDLSLHRSIHGRTSYVSFCSGWVVGFLPRYFL